MNDTNPILIAGGGLGGLAAALALARKGRRTIVLEQSPQLGEIGAGIQLGPNAFRAFAELGLGREAQQGIVFVDELVLMDAVAGGRITSIPLGADFRERFGFPYAVAHRADLHVSLQKACADSGLVDVRVSSRVASYEQDGKHATAILTSGERVTGAGLIGADGLWSAVRAQMVKDGPPVISGHTTYRSVIPIDLMPKDLRWNAATLWAGPKVHLVHYPLKGSSVFNLVVTTHNNATEPAAGKPVSKDEMRPFFEHICPQALQIVEHGVDWKYWVLCDREPVSRWSDARVALLGDAAHPMLQYFAQGACMALEDGVCLAQMVDQHGDNLPAAFAAYTAKRAPRTGRVQLGSRLIGEYVYHPDGARAAVRDSVLGARTPEEHYDAMAWLYDGPDGRP